MKVLNLAIDDSVFDANSATAKRLIGYGKFVSQYVFVVPHKSTKQIKLSDNVICYGIGGKSRITQFFKIYFLAKKLLKNNGFDVITVQDPFELSIIAWVLGHKFKVGFNVQEHGNIFGQKYWRRESWGNFYRYCLGRFLVKRADSVRVVGKRSENSLINGLKIKKEKVINVPVYTDAPEHVLPPKDPGFKGKFVFLTMARFVKAKNLPLMVRAFSIVSKSCPKAVLLMVGSGPEKSKLVSLVKKLDLKNKVLFVDWVTDIYEYYAKADCYVLTSNYEGWGRVILEAANCRLPIIMTDVGCAGEIIKNEESGLLVPVKDEKAFAKAMIRVYESPDLCKKLGENAYTTIKNAPSKQENAKLYLESWERAIQIKKGF